MALLSATVSLHDVRDVEAFTWNTINRSGKAGLSGADLEELFAFLLEVSLVAANRYDETRAGKHPSFAGYLLHIQQFRVIDWKRANGPANRVGRQRVKLVSLDELRSDLDGERELERALARKPVDGADDRVAARGWMDPC